MIIRAPTRTKTKSFNGRQMAFKFPSTDSLQDVRLDEYHLNNHHLLNDNVGKCSDDAASQILSDYTSASNTNTQSGHSSNGYYSFANISDNTTSSAKVNNANQRQSVISNDPNRASDVRGSVTPLLEPLSDEAHDDNRSSPRLGMSPMEMIPENNGFSSFSTVFQSIPTAANISYDISSSISSAKSQESEGTSVRKFQPNRLQDTPAMTRVGSMHSTRSSLLSNRNRTSLKRSKAVRCKGGLLQYFQLLRLKFKKQLRKLICGIRERISKKKMGKNSGYRSGKPLIKRSSKAGDSHRSSERNDMRSSHLKRTQRYVSNLQRSMSNKSLQPVLVPKTNLTSPTKHQGIIGAEKEDKITSNPTTSLRRTKSSIRRAASVINTSPGPKSSSEAELRAPDDENTHIALNNKKPGLVRSAGCKSLNSLARQPSIVVKNKVIPLSMHHYPIEEEDDDEEEDEYVISTNSMRPLTPLESVSSENESFTDAEEPSEHPEQLSQALNHYFRVIIARRILMKLQIAEYQKSGLKRSYLNAIESIIKEYDSESNVSDLFNSLGSTNPTTDDTSGQEEQADETDRSIEFSVQSPFGSVTRLRHKGSTISLSPGNLRRSLTLPIGVKV